MRHGGLYVVFAVLVMGGSCTVASGHDITDHFLTEEYGYIVNPQAAYIDIINGDTDFVLLGNNIIFNGTPSVTISGPSGTFHQITLTLYGTSDLTGDGIIDTALDTSQWLSLTGNYTVSDGANNTETLIVVNPVLKVDLKVGNHSVTSILAGTPLRLDLDTNLDDMDSVDLRIIGPEGMICEINGQRFRDVNISQLWVYGSFNTSEQIDTTGWMHGRYTFQIRTNPENARGLSYGSNTKVIEITKPVVDLEPTRSDPWVNETIILTVHGVPYHGIHLWSYSPCAVFEGGKYDYTGPDTDEIWDTMDEDGIRHYAVHFTDTGCYTIGVEDLVSGIDYTADISVNEPEILDIGVEDGDIQINLTTDWLPDDRVDLVMIDPDGNRLYQNPKNSSQPFYAVRVEDLDRMFIDTDGWDDGKYLAWVETNHSFIPGNKAHTNPVTFEISDGRASVTPCVILFSQSPPYAGEDGGIIDIGEEILLYGTATGNSTVDVAIDDVVVRTDIPVQESGSFIDTLPTDNLTPGFKEIEVFIDTPFALGENVAGVEDNGSNRVFLRSKERILSLYVDTAVIGNDLTIHGTATGGSSVDIAIEDEIVATEVSIDADGSFEVVLPTPGTPHTDTAGLKSIKAFIDTAFAVGENVSEAASSGGSGVFLVEGVEEGEIGAYVEENETVELHCVYIAVVGPAGHNITVDSSDRIHTIFPWGLEDNPWVPSLPFNHRIDEDGVRTYGIYFNDTGTYTITVTDIDTGKNDSVEILVEEKNVTFDMVSNCTIGDYLLIKGRANVGTYVTIAVDDYVYSSQLMLDENGEFEEMIDTAKYSWAFSVPGQVRLRAYIDRWPAGSGAIAPDEKEDGSTIVQMLPPNLTAWLSTNEINQGERFRISGYAPGSKVVDLIAISPDGGNGTGLGCGATGITEMKLAVFKGDHGFSKIIDVCDLADIGDHVIFVSNPGINQTYDGIYTDNLLEGIIWQYCGGNPEMLGSFTQEELVDIIRNATVNAPGSDDLLQELHLSVVSSPVSSGDLNSDGTIDMTDVYLLLDHVGNHGDYEAIADVNCDGSVNMGDVILLLNHVGDSRRYNLDC